MAWSIYDSVMSFIMIGTGTIVVLAPRWLETKKAEGFMEKEHEFVHTFLLATLKFAGELVCLLLYGILFWRSVGKSGGRMRRENILEDNPLYNAIDRMNERIAQEERRRLQQQQRQQQAANQANDDDQMIVAHNLDDDNTASGDDVPLINPVINDGGVDPAPAPAPVPQPHREPVRPTRRIHERPRPINPNWPPPIQDPNHFNIALFLLPAMFDLASQALLFVGLKLTYPESYFMLRGAVLFFTALLSVAFMARPLQIQMWFGLAFGIVGLVGLGLLPYLPIPNTRNDDSGYDPYGIAAGDLLIVMSFIMNATQAVYEEKFVTKHRINPLLAVGLEGLFGFVISFFLTIGFSFVNAGAFSKLPHHHLEDPIDAFYQMSNSWQILLFVVGSILAAPLYLYTGIFLGKSQGAMARMVLDTAKTILFFLILLVAMTSIKFHFLQAIGIVLVVVSIIVFNEFAVHIYRSCRGLPPAEEEMIPPGAMVPLTTHNNHCHVHNEQ